MYYLFFGITFICYVSANLSRVQIPSKLLQNALSKSKGINMIPSKLLQNALTNSKINMLPDKESNTYFDKPDNQMLIPVPFQEHKATKKFYKKHPKSTIQKIIKRNKKYKKTMSKRLTTKPTLPPASDEMVDDFDDKDYDLTTQASLRKKKWNKKIPKYHSQIQRMPNRISPKYKRTRRDTDRDNTVIFQDFDEFEFLDHKKDYDVVKTHFKKYW